MRTKANGINFNYTIDGPDGAPWVMFSNSLCTTTAMWDEQAAALKSKYRVLRYDQRGHGATDAPAGRYAYDTLIADAVALMDAVGVDKAWFGGLSMGGATALGLAQQHPDRVHGIFICDHSCKSTPATTQQWEERIVTARQNGMEAMVELDRVALVPAGDPGQEPALHRQGEGDDPRDAGRRLHRLRGGARQPRLQFQGRDGEVPGACSSSARRTAPRRPP